MIYCRISLAMHGDTVKVKRQEKLCRRVAERKGWNVTAVYCDNNKSAWRRDRRRDDWDAMLASIDRGEVDAVIIYHGDRLIRQPYDLELLLRLAEGRGLLLASPTGERNLDNPDDRYALRQEANKACAESDNISRRTKVVHEEKARKGKPRKGGNRAFGYKRSGKVVEAEAEHYRDAVARIIAGESKRSIIRQWRAQGIVTTRGGPWEPDTFSYMLRNPRYAGLSSYHGEIVGKGRWDALVDRETWETLQAACGAIADRFTQTPKDQTSKYLLTYIATHAGCGGKMRMHHNGRQQALSYSCGRIDCPQKVTRNMAYVDEFVIGYVLRVLSDPELWAEVEAATKDNGAAAKLVTMRERRAETLAAFAESDTMSPAALEVTLRRMDERIARLEEQVAARQQVHVLAGCRDMTRPEWDALPMDRRRAIVKETVTVEILPGRKGRGFDTSSVAVARRRTVNGAGRGAGGLELVSGPAPE